ncbi:MAG: RHS repeat-associated core domain-containing protein [Steroidobacteraceae bacterium]|nr:RHS repeat-associated core domain-containing protein [Steroidobacteraceae bacterium]
MIYRQAGTAAPYTNRQNLAFEWDLNGNLKKRIDVGQANLTEEFFYDALNRLDYSQLNGVTNLDLTLDAIGNITAKTSSTDPAENVGSYTYHATKKHAVVSTSNGWSFGYDANGNMTSYKGNSITWTSYNLPSSIAAAGQSSQFWYGPNRNRWKQLASYPSGSETTIYVGGVLEKVTVPTGTAWRHYVGAGSAKVVYTRWSTGTQDTKYLTADHLNSSSVLMDSSGNTLVGMSFAAYGRRRGATWTGAPSSGDWTQINNATRHGYTGHEHLDNVNLIHMNGRVFEPVLGRFLSADPFMPGSLGSQAPNRYAYVGNRPLSLTDPSGFAPPKQGFTLYSPINGMSYGEILSGYEILKEIGDIMSDMIAKVGTDQVLSGLAASNSSFVRNLASGISGSGNRDADRTNRGRGYAVDVECGGEYVACAETGSQPTLWTYENVQPNITSAWVLGAQWLTGLGQRQHVFGQNDPLTVQLRQHEWIRETRNYIAEQIATGGSLSGSRNYSVAGVEGVFKYIKDYSTLLTLGTTGNIVVTYLGSYNLYYHVTDINADGTARVDFYVWNASTLSSVTHLPILGYTEWWAENVSSVFADYKQGPMSPTEQHISWSENIPWGP